MKYRVNSSNVVLCKMEKISPELVKEALSACPDLTVEEFILRLKDRWLEQVDQVFEREVCKVVEEYQKAADTLINDAEVI